MPLTLSEVTSSLSRYAGSGNTFLARLNETRARLIQGGTWKGMREQVELTVYADADSNSIVTLPREYDVILAGALQNASATCTGDPLGIRNSFDEFNLNGLGYGGQTNNFHEVSGFHAVYNEWETGTGMFIRLKFEVSESSGVVHLWGNFDGEQVYSLYASTTWIKGEKVAFSGTTTVTSTKKFEAKGFSAVKPSTNGRISVFAVDDDGVETQVGLWEPGETVPRRKRYKVPECEDVEPVTSTTPVVPSQYYTKEELLALFDFAPSISVSDAGTTDLDYGEFLLRVVKITAAAGAGSYTRSVTLSTEDVKDGATFRILLQIAASTNPIINIYNESTGGTLLVGPIQGVAGGITYVTLNFGYDAANTLWVYEGQSVV